jgi:hypothetical protein
VFIWARPTFFLLGPAHPSDVSLPSLSGRHARAAHVASPRRVALGLLPAPLAGRGQAPRHPHAVWHPTPGPPLPPSVALPPSRFLPARSSVSTPLRLLLSSAQLSPPLPVPEPPPSTTGSLSFARIPVEHRRRPPLLGELLSELPIPAISCKSLTPSPLPSCRTSSPPSATTGAPSPPPNAAARRCLRHLTVDLPFRCAPALSSLSGTFPVTPSRSPATPCHRRATAEPPVSAPPHRPVCGDRAGARRPVAPLGWAARPWPSRCFGRPRVAGHQPRGL